MSLLVVSCYVSLAGALHLAPLPELAAPNAEEAVREQLLEAQRKFAEASDVESAGPVSFLDAVAAGGGSAGIPVVDLSLSLGLDAWPSISQAIAEAESTRQSFEAEHADAELRAFNAGLVAAQGRIADAVRQLMRSWRDAGSAPSFVEIGAVSESQGAAEPEVVAVTPGSGAQVIEVDVPAAAPINEEAVGDALRKAERKRAVALSEVFRAWSLDFDAMTDYVVHLLQVEWAGAGADKDSNFVGGAPQQVGFAESKPGLSTARSLIDDGAKRRDMSMEVARRRHLALQLSFLQRLNGMVERSLRESVAASGGVSFLDVERSAGQSVKSGISMEALVGEVEAGGRTARRALQELASLIGDADARAAIAASGAVQAAETLLKRPSSDEATRAAAGSLLTLLTDLPVTAEISDEQSGSGGHIEIVLPRPSRVYGPDALAAELAAGVAPFSAARGDA